MNKIEIGKTKDHIKLIIGILCFYKAICYLIIINIKQNHYTIYNHKFNQLSNFRNGFWISTTARFFYIEVFMTLFKETNIFHIENDIMLYQDLNKIYNFCFPC